MSDYDDFCDDCYEEGYEDGYNEGRKSRGPRGTQAVIERHRRENEANGCYIATAVYGSYDCPEVWVLRRLKCTLETGQKTHSIPEYWTVKIHGILKTGQLFSQN